MKVKISALARITLDIAARVLILTLILFRPAAAQPTEAACRDALAAYRAAPSVSRLEPLYPCLKDASPALRAEILDKIVCREIWSDPRFDRSVHRRLYTVAREYNHGVDPKTQQFAFGMMAWLDIWERDIDPEGVEAKRRARRPLEDFFYRDGRFSTFRILAAMGLYLAALVSLKFRIQRLGLPPRDAPHPAPPGVKVS